MYYLLFYKTVDNYEERREPFRQLHLKHVQDSIARGEFKMGGAYTDPPDGAALVFEADDRTAVEEFASRDPYVQNGLITHWEVRAWNVVIQA